MFVAVVRAEVGAADGGQESAPQEQPVARALRRRRHPQRHTCHIGEYRVFTAHLPQRWVQGVIVHLPHRWVQGVHSAPATSVSTGCQRCNIVLANIFLKRCYANRCTGYMSLLNMLCYPVPVVIVLLVLCCWIPALTGYSTEMSTCKYSEIRLNLFRATSTLYSRRVLHLMVDFRV